MYYFVSFSAQAILGRGSSYGNRRLQLVAMSTIPAEVIALNGASIRLFRMEGLGQFVFSAIAILLIEVLAMFLWWLTNLKGLISVNGQTSPR